MQRLDRRWVADLTAVQLIASCRRHGLFEFLNQRPVALETIAAEFGANKGNYLRSVLHLLAGTGWLTRDSGDSYRVGPQVSFLEQIPKDIGELLRLTNCDGSIDAWLERSRNGWEGADPAIAELLDNALSASIFYPLNQLGGAGVLEAGPEQASGSSDLTLEPVREFFAKIKQGYRDQDRFRFNRAETEMEAVSADLACLISPMTVLDHLDDLIFGNALSTLNRKPEDGLDGTRLRYLAWDQVLTQACLNELQDLIGRTFDQYSLEQQPRYLAHVGCGDGSLLRSIYEAIRTRSARGQSVDLHPLRLIGVDASEKSLSAAAGNLRDLPYVLIRLNSDQLAQLGSELSRYGIRDLERVLYIESFLTPAGSSLSEHLQAWNKTVSGYGLINLEGHCVQTKAGEPTTRSYFDFYERLAGVHLFEAPVFLMAAAGAGLFPDRTVSRRFREEGSSAQLTINRFLPRRYSGRHPVEADVPRLRELEVISWPANLGATESELYRRINLAQTGQVILEYDGRIIAACYSQRISGVDRLVGITNAEIPQIYDAAGKTAMLLGICVHPEMHGQGLADELIDFMLVYFSANEDIENVVGVTRCHHYGQHRGNEGMSHGDYVGWRNAHGQLVEPMLRFHESHGAVVGAVLSGFRPDDFENEGAGVLIEYALGVTPPVKEKSEPDGIRTGSEITGLVRACICQVLGPE
ncbi:MAG TPA: GNAT family N-acetyltransferase, partial [Chthoniobacterales bacterium]